MDYNILREVFIPGSLPAGYTRSVEEDYNLFLGCGWRLHRDLALPHQRAVHFVPTLWRGQQYVSLGRQASHPDFFLLLMGSQSNVFQKRLSPCL